MELCRRGGSIRDRCFHRAAGRSRHSGKAPLMCCAASFVIVMSAVMKTYELNVSLYPCRLVEVARAWCGCSEWPSAPGSAPLCCSASICSLCTSCCCCVWADTFENQLPLYTEREQGNENGDAELTQAINMFSIVTCNNLYLHRDIAL